LVAIFSVWPALSAFCLIVAVSSSMLADTSSTLAACSLEPWARLSAAPETWVMPSLTPWAFSSITSTTFMIEPLRNHARSRAAARLTPRTPSRRIVDWWASASLPAEVDLAIFTL